MSDEVVARVRGAIEHHGPIGFDEYMDLALYGPNGFFERPVVGAGREGHFVTGPHVHPFVFAHCVRDALLETWLALGEPDPLPVVELGAGDGTLAEALLGAFGELPGPHVAYTAVEISDGARTALERRGIRAVAELDGLDPFEGAVVANELLDNLPFAPVRAGPGGPMEVRVGLDGSALVEVEVPWDRASVRLPALAPGETTVVPIGAFSLLDGLSEVLRAGSVLLIDYGSTDGPTGPPRGYRGHRRIDDVLRDPGTTDITSGVDLTMVAERARASGFEAFEPVTQADALSALGRDRWDATMRRLQSDLVETGRGAEAVRVWETRSRASLLVEPSGLGAFWWLVLATEGLSEPDWLARARAIGAG